MSSISVTATAKQQAVSKIDCGDAPSSCMRKVCNKVKRSGGATSDDAVKSYVRTAASCGAEAACSAVGLAAAAPVCGKIADIATGIVYEGAKKVVRKIGRVFTGGKSSAQKAREALSTTQFLYSGFIAMLDHLREQQWQATVAMHAAASEAVAAFKRVDPEGSWSKTDALLQLQKFGVHMVARWPPLPGIRVSVRHSGSGIAQFHSAGRPRDEGKGFLAPDFEYRLYVVIAQVGTKQGEYVDPRDALSKAIGVAAKEAVPTFNQQQAALEQWLAGLELASIELMAYAAEKGTQSRALREARKLQGTSPTLLNAMARVRTNELEREQRLNSLKAWAPWLALGTVAVGGAATVAYRRWR